MASIESGFVIDSRRAHGGPFRSPSQGNGPPRMISRAVANHQAYGHLAGPLKVRQRRRPIARSWPQQNEGGQGQFAHPLMKVICGASSI